MRSARRPGIAHHERRARLSGAAPDRARRRGSACAGVRSGWRPRTSRPRSKWARMARAPLRRSPAPTTRAGMPEREAAGAPSPTPSRSRTTPSFGPRRGASSTGWPAPASRRKRRPASSGTSTWRNGSRTPSRTYEAGTAQRAWPPLRTQTPLLDGEWEDPEARGELGVDHAQHVGVDPVELTRPQRRDRHLLSEERRQRLLELRGDDETVGDQQLADPGGHGSSETGGRT
jgi:hypothetical protein